MISVNGVPVLADDLEVLEELKRQANADGADLFRVFKVSGNNIMTMCPFHKGGVERKPSFGISTEGKMNCHCFTCGWSGTLDKMISNVFGIDDDGIQGQRWLSRYFATLTVEYRRPIELHLSRAVASVPQPIIAVTQAELDKYNHRHPYMYERGLTDDVIELFGVGYDVSSMCITFPVCNLDGVCVFVARRSVKGKFFNYPEGAEKPVYGAYLVNSRRYPEVIICESVLNALTCWKFGRPAVALLGTGTVEQYNILRKLPARKYIIATDPDKAGRIAAHKLRMELSNSKIVTQFDIPTGKDINDLDESFLSLFEFY